MTATPVTPATRPSEDAGATKPTPRVPEVAGTATDDLRAAQGVAREPRHLALLHKADNTERALSDLPERGARLVQAVADAYREAADIYAGDPTLHNCPAGRERDLDLAVELCRQIPVIVSNAVRGDLPDRWPIADRWAEAEAAAERLPVVLARARAAARPDHATPEGSRAISRMWLTAAAPRIFRLAEQTAEALVKAGSLPHVCPEVGHVGELAQELMNLATALEATCLTPCDADCDADCHEHHQVPWKRHPEPGCTGPCERERITP